MGIIAGTSKRTINCEIGDNLQGQLYPRIAEYIRDDLEANVLFLSDEKESILFISCDLVALTTEYANSIISEISEKLKIPSSSIIIGCTHTHTGPSTTSLLYDVPSNKKYLEKLHKVLLELSEQAKKKAEPAKIGYKKGYAHIGYNRRTCWQDRTHMMYGDRRKKEGFTGSEGPFDPIHTVLAVVNEKNELIGIVQNNSCHSTCLEGKNYVSADFPGESRRLIREAVGNIPVLYLQGASGDISPWDMLHPEKKVSGERRLKEIGSLLAGETLKLINDINFSDNMVVKTASEKLKVGVRIPTEEELKKAKEMVDAGEEKTGRWNYILQRSILKLHNDFKDNPFEEMPINTIKIGDLSIATNTCELYNQFGLDIKQRSPFKTTMVVQLANGWSGYCPTIYGVMGGGYSGMTIYWTRLEPYAGYKIVDDTCNLLWQLNESEK